MLYHGCTLAQGRPRGDRTSADGREPAYEMTLQMRDGHARLTISGTFDRVCLDAVAGIVGTGGPVRGPVDIDAGKVRRVARGCVAVLRDVAVQRVRAGLSDITFSAVSVPIASALADLGIPTQLPIALCSWGVRD
jgi:hypothetical protein